MKKSIENFIRYSYFGDGNYRTHEQGSQSYRLTDYAKFRNANPNYVTIVSSGNNAPRGGKIGNFEKVVFTDEFKQLVINYHAAKEAAEQLEIAAKEAKEAEIEKYVAMIEPILGESRANTEKRLSKAINMKINATIFHSAVSRIRLRGAYHANIG